MQVLRLSTQLHKWIALVVGLQVLFWVAGGLVMTAIPIERVRSEHRLAQRDLPPLEFDAAVPAAEAARAAGVGPLASATLKGTPRGPVWVLTPVGKGEPKTVDALTGGPLERLTAAEARAVAQAAYTGPGQPVAARFYAKPPQETGKETPLWRVEFDDPEGTAFYVAPDTGEVVTRRSNVWRFYDFFWRLHILDFKEGDDFNHPLLVALTALTLPVVITGLILLWIRVGRDLRGFLARRRRAAAAGRG
ncbi:MAG TPA: PepSY domain-containing protein [Caulobacteraceae bacterium]|jgi:uncharacterized iron-regulated membrane protein